MKTKKSIKRASKVNVIEKLAQKNVTGGVTKMAYYCHADLSIAVSEDVTC